MVPFKLKGKGHTFTKSRVLKNIKATAKNINSSRPFTDSSVNVTRSEEPKKKQLALRTPLSGNFNNGSANNQGSNGNFWSSTAAGNSSNTGAVEAWMNSSGHRENILNSSYNYTGIGVVKSQKYGKIYVQMFMGK